MQLYNSKRTHDAFETLGRHNSFSINAENAVKHTRAIHLQGHLLLSFSKS